MIAVCICVVFCKQIIYNFPLDLSVNLTLACLFFFSSSLFSAILRVLRINNSFENVQEDFFFAILTYYFYHYFFTLYVLSVTRYKLCKIKGRKIAYNYRITVNFFQVCHLFTQRNLKMVREERINSKYWSSCPSISKKFPFVIVTKQHGRCVSACAIWKMWMFVYALFWCAK